MSTFPARRVAHGLWLAAGLLWVGALLLVIGGSPTPGSDLLLVLVGTISMAVYASVGVAAQDEERRRLERNIHDGAQQQLVALTVKARLVEQTIEREPEKARELVSQIQAETTVALEDLRDIARGIYPPLLADKGLLPALGAQARRAAVQVAVDGDGVGRFERDVDAGVYFGVLEALNNVSKYADASRVDVRLSNGGGRLTFEVRDDAAGFDTTATSYGTGLRGMQDRLEALGGTLEVRSEPNAGTRVLGSVPASGMAS